MDWIIDNLALILGAILGTQALAQIIVNLTPTPRDDEIVGKAYRAVEIVAGIVTKQAKQEPPNRVPPAAPVQLSLGLPDINVRF